ncbi:MAG: glycosyltransferase [Lachnospiraceae bacterium]
MIRIFWKFHRRTVSSAPLTKKRNFRSFFEDNEIDIICILPIWPETFSYTVSEAWLNGIPIVATDIGAVGERIRKTGGGWLVKPDASPDEVMQLLHHIIDHPEEYQAKKEIVDDMEMKTVEQMCEEYRKFTGNFWSLRKKNCRKTRSTGISFSRDWLFGDPSIGGSGSIAAMNRLKNENAALKASIEVTKGTISYKMARKISDAKIPFKEQMKRFLHRK